MFAFILPVLQSTITQVFTILALIAAVGKDKIGRESATSAILEFALRFNFFVLKHCRSCVAAKVFKICCASIALRFQNFFG